jgi:putative flippase GtrA
MLKRIKAVSRSFQAVAGRWQFAVFLAVGLLNTAFGYGCFILLLYLHVHYSLAALVSTVLGVLFNFRTTGRIVFRNHDNRLLLRFIGVYALVYVLSVLGLRLLLAVGVEPYVGGAILLLPAAVLSYFLQKRFVFFTEVKLQSAMRSKLGMAP